MHAHEDIHIGAHLVTPLTHGSTYSFGAFGAVTSYRACMKRKGVKAPNTAICTVKTVLHDLCSILKVKQNCNARLTTTRVQGLHPNTVICTANKCSMFSVSFKMRNKIAMPANKLPKSASHFLFPIFTNRYYHLVERLTKHRAI